jgi:hypothetical protein
MNKNIFLTIGILLSFSRPASANIMNDSMPAGKNYDKAMFRMWYPNGIKSIEGIIVLMPGSNADGRALVNDNVWQSLAKKNNFALVGCYYTDRPHENMDIEEYANVKEGSGQALLGVLSKFAKKSGFLSLANVPLALWGHSAGGEFNYEFVCWRPERVIAFVVNKGGFYYSALASQQARDVPGIIFTGENDSENRKNILKGIFTMNRRVGALWCFAEEPNNGHSIGQTQKLAAAFFDEIIPLRIARKIENKKPNLMKPIQPNAGYAGDFKNNTLYKITEEQMNDFSLSFIPNLKFGEVWLKFVKNSPF